MKIWKQNTLKSYIWKRPPLPTTYPDRWGDDTWPSYGAGWCESVLSSLHWWTRQLPPLDRTACKQRPVCDWVRDAMSHWVCSIWLWLSAQWGQRSLKMFGKRTQKKMTWARISHDNIITKHQTFTPATIRPVTYGKITAEIHTVLLLADVILHVYCKQFNLCL